MLNVAAPGQACVCTAPSPVCCRAEWRLSDQPFTPRRLWVAALSFYLRYQPMRAERPPDRSIDNQDSGPARWFECWHCVHVLRGCDTTCAGSYHRVVNTREKRPTGIIVNIINFVLFNFLYCLNFRHIDTKWLISPNKWAGWLYIQLPLCLIGLGLCICILLTQVTIIKIFLYLWNSEKGKIEFNRPTACIQHIQYILITLIFPLYFTTEKGENCIFSGKLEIFIIL